MPLVNILRTLRKPFFFYWFRLFLIFTFVYGFYNMFLHLKSHNSDIYASVQNDFEAIFWRRKKTVGTLRELNVSCSHKHAHTHAQTSDWRI